MEYPLPQFLSIKPKIAGPFNFRELAYVVGGALVCTIFYFTVSSVVTFLIISAPIMGVSLILAFGKTKGFPIPTIMRRSFLFTFASKKYIWKKIEAPAPIIPRAKEKKEKPTIDLTANLKISEKSRLKDISKLIEIHPK
ncbi:MAG: PrgI family protein [Patescibacteria group bacterium]|nr:PrgI family protein [Patescibacteria group bacterium]